MITAKGKVVTIKSDSLTVSIALNSISSINHEIDHRFTSTQDWYSFRVDTVNSSFEFEYKSEVAAQKHLNKLLEVWQTI